MPLDICPTAAWESPSSGKLCEEDTHPAVLRDISCCSLRVELQGTCLSVLRMTIPAEIQESDNF